MQDLEFQQRVIERLTAIETNCKYFATGLELIRQHGERITVVEQSTKSAHHRISGVLAAVSVRVVELA